MSPYIPFLRFLCQFPNARPKPHCRPSSSTPATPARHGQPPPSASRPHQPPCELHRPLLVLTDPLSPSNCSRSPVTDDGRRRRLRPRHRTPLSSLPRFQLTLHRASSHRQEASRPLLHRPRPPEHGPRRFPPPPAACLCRTATISRPLPIPCSQRCARTPWYFSLPSDLAAGNHPRRTWLPTPCPFSPLAKDHGLEGAKAQGAICNPHDSEE
jgi:hypothetical protein